jgi:hypothetical protein
MAYYLHPPPWLLFGLRKQRASSDGETILHFRKFRIAGETNGENVGTEAMLLDQRDSTAVQSPDRRPQASLSSTAPRCFSSAARREDPIRTGLECLPESTREFLSKNYRVAVPKQDPINHGTFVNRQNCAYSLFCKPPAEPVHREDCTGVFNEDEVRRYYTTNQVPACRVPITHTLSRSLSLCLCLCLSNLIPEMLLCLGSSTMGTRQSRQTPFSRPRPYGVRCKSAGLSTEPQSILHVGYCLPEHDMNEEKRETTLHTVTPTGGAKAVL